MHVWVLLCLGSSCACSWPQWRETESDAETKVVLAKKLHADKSLKIDGICKTLRLSRSTFYRYARL